MYKNYYILIHGIIYISCYFFNYSHKHLETIPL